ncbi:uncharacterized protein LOC126704276 [Quercus robur]|uniref:uncharacterized protein LOC126704276 n=1 Tax=Quercus robur TaxID=38942 RepID=UPI002162B3F8|nr:uncharacterized protein LOC126704276 [Quercus robur]
MEVNCEELEKVLVGLDPEKFFQIGSELPAQEKSTLVDFLRRNQDVFAWDPYEAPGVDSDLICHHLNVNPAITPKKQPPRRPSKEHADAVREEVVKLKKAGAIKEVFYPECADYIGRIAKWGTTLGAFDIRYMPRTAIKGQVLADLVAEFAEPTLEGMEMSGSPSADGKLVNTVSQHEHNRWRVHIDGAANQRGSGVGLVLVSPEGITIEKSLRLGFSATNNEAKYEALLEGMSMIRKLGGKCASIFSDSRLVVGQINGELEAKDERMQGYLAWAKHLQTHFDDFRVTHIPRSGNTHADSLATLATSSAQPLPRVILVEDLSRPTTEKAKGIRVHNVGAGPSWMDPLVLFLKHDTLPDDKVEADKIRRKASRFWLSEDSKLYRRSFSGPYLLCVHPEAIELILEELHEGICGSHTGGRFAPNIHQPGGELNPLSSPWPFAQWGLDILGPFPKAAGNRKFLLVSTDYFTKWVEAEVLANIRDVDVKKFVWKNIVTRFGTPHTLISDNGLQFDSKAFREYCNELGITNRYSTPAYPQGNGQAEAINKTIVNGLKKRLDDAKGRWVEEIAHVLWTYRTTPRRSTGETPFSLTYGAEAVIPLEINFPTQRTTAFNPIANNSLLEKNLDLLEERRENAMVHLAYYQQKLKRGYDAKQLMAEQTSIYDKNRKESKATRIKGNDTIH